MGSAALAVSDPYGVVGSDIGQLFSDPLDKPTPICLDFMGIPAGIRESGCAIFWNRSRCSGRSPRFTDRVCLIGCCDCHSTVICVATTHEEISLVDCLDFFFVGGGEYSSFFFFFFFL